jgi:hypothetical protein
LSGIERRYLYFAGFLIATFVAILAVQCFQPPIIGLANNGDFSKMIGRFGLGPVNNGPDSEIKYVAGTYMFHPARYWKASNLSSELLLIFPATLIAALFSDMLFDIRIMGAVHAVVLVAAFAMLLPLYGRLPGWRRYVLPLVPLAIFCDVHYVSHMNSFFTDTAALVGLLWTIVLALHIAVRKEYGPRWVAAFSVAACFLIGSKPSHAPLVVCLFPLAVAAALRSRSRRAALGFACLLPLAAFVTFAKAVPDEVAMNQYSAIFMKITPGSPDPLRDLRELGLGQEYVAHSGRYGYEPGSPDYAWFVDFGRRVPPGRLVLWYAHHPWRTLHVLAGDLRGPAHEIRMAVLGNYRQEDGFPPGAQARHFGLWTRLRARWIERRPWHLPLWHCGFLALSAGLAWRYRFRTAGRLAAVALAVSGMAFLEFAGTSLGAAVETARHLFLFHALTDVTVCMALAGAAMWGRFQKA